MEDLIGSFGNAEQVATFFLHEAFRFAHSAAHYEVASTIFGKRLMKVYPSPGWIPPVGPSTIQEWLAMKSDIDDDDETIEKISEAWQSALQDANRSKVRIRKQSRFGSSTDVAGHVVFLTLCVEAVLNRHLYYQKQQRIINADIYKSIDRAELLPKLMFCFKEDLQSKRINISKIKKLVTYRNHSVHYRVGNDDVLKPTPEELLGIWKDVGILFGYTEGDPTKISVEHYSQEFSERWLR